MQEIYMILNNSTITLLISTTYTFPVAHRSICDVTRAIL